MKLLQTACEVSDETILKSEDLSGTYIETNGETFIVAQERKEVAKWEGALEKLLNMGFIQLKGLSGDIFVVSKMDMTISNSLNDNGHDNMKNHSKYGAAAFAYKAAAPLFLDGLQKHYRFCRMIRVMIPTATPRSSSIRVTAKLTSSFLPGVR